jgi:biopolymer transport protein ExbD
VRQAGHRLGVDLGGDAPDPAEAAAGGLDGAENADAAQAVTILGDKDIPYRLLRKVMVSAARAGYTDVSFAVQRKAGAQ